MRDCFQWHAAEEIEHKSVAFDVLKRVNDSYALRMVGLFSAVFWVSAVWIVATIMLLRQERNISKARLLKDAVFGMCAVLLGSGRFAWAVFKYMRPGFHPNDIDNLALATEFFANWRTQENFKLPEG